MKRPAKLQIPSHWQQLADLLAQYDISSLKDQDVFRGVLSQYLPEKQAKILAEVMNLDIFPWLLENGTKDLSAEMLAQQMTTVKPEQRSAVLTWLGALMMQQESPSAHFIATEAIGSGSAGERQVWETVKSAFRNRHCLAFWRYPIFSATGYHKEPDILIADRELGLIIIEVKGFPIEAITEIHGHEWRVQGFGKPLYPYHQAKNQWHALNMDGPGQVWIALPKITYDQWQMRGFNHLSSSPPVLFQNDLSPPNILSCFKKPPPWPESVWKQQVAHLGGWPKQVPEKAEGDRSGILKQLRGWLYQQDIQQLRTGFQIPPGPQRIRGIAGSGKTMLLCQKAAHMHLKYPHWRMALVFFTRTLYEPMIAWVDRWLAFMSQGKIRYSENSNLQILHAWGARQRPGLYSTLCAESDISPMPFEQIPEMAPADKLAFACGKLLSEKIAPIFEAVLIDEAQDLIVDDRLKYDGCQPIFQLAWQALKPTPEGLRRLIWAYDEAQSLDTLKIPSSREIFGENGNDIFGRGPVYPGGIEKSVVMRHCYRTPGPILTAAHAIGMGLLRPGGMLTGLTRQDDWEAIGYMVLSGRFYPGHEIVLHRPPRYSPNPVPQLWKKPVIQFDTFRERKAELQLLADRIRQNLDEDGLPAEDILVIVLGPALESQVARFLMQQGISVYIPTASSPNQLYPRYPEHLPDRFRYNGAVTISRIHRAKGQEAAMVYGVGLDQVALREDSIGARNQLFVALTRSRAWAYISGIGNYPLYDEFRQVLASGDTFRFTFHPPQRVLGEI